MKKLFSTPKILLPLLVLLVMSLGCVAVPRHTLADNANESLNNICTQSGNVSAACDQSNKPCSATTPSPGIGCSTGANPIVVTILKTVRLLNFVIGVAAVISIIVGGIRYTLSRGDSGQIESAKNTILYSVIGLVVALSAHIIIIFILNRI